MVNKELRKYILDQEKKGYSEKQIIDYLTKQGYKKKEIDEALEHHKNDKVILYSITFLVSAIGSSALLAFFFVLSSAGYIFKSLSVLVLGFLTIILIKNSTEKTRLWLFASTFIAATASLTVFIATKIVSTLFGQLEALAQTGEVSATQLNLRHMFSRVHPLLDTFLVYILFITPTIVYFMRRKDKDLKELYKIAIGAGVLIVLLLILNFIIKFVLGRTMIAPGI